MFRTLGFFSVLVEISPIARRDINFRLVGESATVIERKYASPLSTFRRQRLLSLDYKFNREAYDFCVRLLREFLHRRNRSNSNGASEFVGSPRFFGTDAVDFSRLRNASINVADVRVIIDRHIGRRRENAALLPRFLYLATRGIRPHACSTVFVEVQSGGAGDLDRFAVDAVVEDVAHGGVRVREETISSRAFLRRLWRFCRTSVADCNQPRNSIPTDTLGRIGRVVLVAREISSRINTLRLTAYNTSVSLT